MDVRSKLDKVAQDISNWFADERVLQYTTNELGHRDLIEEIQGNREDRILDNLSDVANFVGPLDELDAGSMVYLMNRMEDIFQSAE